MRVCVSAISTLYYVWHVFAQHSKSHRHRFEAVFPSVFTKLDEGANKIFKSKKNHTSLRNFLSQFFTHFVPSRLRRWIFFPIFSTYLSVFVIGYATLGKFPFINKYHKTCREKYVSDKTTKKSCNIMVGFYLRDVPIKYWYRRGNPKIEIRLRNFS